MKIQNPSVTISTVTCQAMTFVTTANITSVVETGGYFVRTVICTIIWASFLMSHVNDMKGDRMSREEAIEKLTKLQDMLAIRALFDESMHKIMGAIEEGKRALQAEIDAEDDGR